MHQSSHASVQRLPSTGIVAIAPFAALFARYFTPAELTVPYTHIRLAEIWLSISVGLCVGHCPEHRAVKVGRIIRPRCPSLPLHLPVPGTPRVHLQAPVVPRRHWRVVCHDKSRMPVWLVLLRLEFLIRAALRLARKVCHNTGRGLDKRAKDQADGICREKKQGKGCQYMLMLKRTHVSQSFPSSALQGLLRARASP